MRDSFIRLLSYLTMLSTLTFHATSFRPLSQRMQQSYYLCFSFIFNPLVSKSCFLLTLIYLEQSFFIIKLSYFKICSLYLYVFRTSVYYLIWEFYFWNFYEPGLFWSQSNLYCLSTTWHNIHLFCVIIPVFTL